MTYLKEIENEKNEEKLKFFAKITHEFKTPINSIIGLLSQMKDIDEDSNKQIKLLNTLNQTENLSKYLLYLINDMIEYSNLNER